MVGLREGTGPSATARAHVAAALLEECDETSHSVETKVSQVSVQILREDLFNHLQFQ